MENRFNPMIRSRFIGRSIKNPKDLWFFFRKFPKKKNIYSSCHIGERNGANELIRSCLVIKMSRSAWNEMGSVKYYMLRRNNEARKSIEFIYNRIQIYLRWTRQKGDDSTDVTCSINFVTVPGRKSTGGFVYIPQPGSKYWPKTSRYRAVNGDQS